MSQDPTSLDHNILGFHSLRICTSNAKALSYYFKVCLGFQEVAYKGLETSSYYTASRVLRNHDCTIVLVSVISSEENDYDRSSIFVPNDKISEIVSSTVNDFVKWFPSQSKQELIDIILRKFTSELPTIQSDNSKNVGNNSSISSNSSNSFTSKTSSTLREKLLAKRIAKDKLELLMIQKFLLNHGDGVWDILLKVKDCSIIYKKSTVKGSAIPIHPPYAFIDANGKVKLATIGVPNTDIIHTFVELNYGGTYLPGFQDVEACKPTSFISLQTIDHVVQSYSKNQMMDYVDFYRKSLGFHRFWSVDEDDVSTGNTSLKSIVMTNGNDQVKIPINEPGDNAKFRGQVEEFYDYNGGPGIQHVAFKTVDIIGTVRDMRNKGVKFNAMSKEYYKTLKERMERDNVKIRESMEEIKSLHILVDYDASTRDPETNICHYILQIFTQPFSDRPTLFFEVIQRYHHNGFGKGTFKGLFESIEAQQSLRGTFKVNKDGEF